jgi:hypothetical protein
MAGQYLASRCSIFTHFRRGEFLEGMEDIEGHFIAYALKWRFCLSCL